MAAPPPQYTMHPYTQYGYSYAPSNTAAVAAADYTWGAAQYSWQTAPPHSAQVPNSLEQEPDALQSRTLFFGRLSDDVAEESLREICQQYGDVKKVAVYPEKHMAFVEFFDLRHAETARDTLRNSEALGKRVEVQFSAVKRPDKDGNTGTLYVRPVSTVHVSGNWTDPNSLESYRELFSKHGELKKVSANRKRETEKFIEFYDLRDAQKALDNLNGYVFNGATLHICFAQNASRTVNKQAERAATSRRTPPDSYGPYRGSGQPHHHAGTSTRGFAAAPYAAVAAPVGQSPQSGAHALPAAVAALYAAAGAAGPGLPPSVPTAAPHPSATAAASPYLTAAPLGYAAAPAYGAYAVPYEHAPAYSIFYQQPNGVYAAAHQWPQAAPGGAVPAGAGGAAAPGAAAGPPAAGLHSYAAASQAARVPPLAAVAAMPAYAPAPAPVVAPAAAQGSRW